jgi:hypothetical protein
VVNGTAIGTDGEHGELRGKLQGETKGHSDACLLEERGKQAVSS